MTTQWQIELQDKLGIPSAVWSSQGKVWLGPEGQQLSSKGDPEAIKRCPYQITVVSLGIPTNRPFEVAYEMAEEFSRLLKKRTKSGGFMKSLMLQRICSSFASGLNTAQKMLQQTMPDDSRDQEELQEEHEHILSGMSAGEIACLREIVTPTTSSAACRKRSTTTGSRTNKRYAPGWMPTSTNATRPKTHFP